MVDDALVTGVAQFGLAAAGGERELARWLEITGRGNDGRLENNESPTHVHSMFLWTISPSGYGPGTLLGVSASTSRPGKLLDLIDLQPG